MDHREVGRYWNENADNWTALARAGFDVYRDLLNTPAFFELLPDVNGLEVITEHNDGICSRDFVRNMRTQPFELVRFHSDHMTLNPGDLISTGCPKGARIKAGDKVRARIEGVGTLGAKVTQGARTVRY